MSGKKDIQAEKIITPTAAKRGRRSQSPADGTPDSGKHIDTGAQAAASAARPRRNSGAQAGRPMEADASYPMEVSGERGLVSRDDFLPEAGDAVPAPEVQADGVDIAAAAMKSRRGKDTTAGARKVFSDNAARAAQTLVELLDHTGGDVRLRAANSILDRVLGKPEQAHKMEGDCLGATIVVVRSGGGDDDGEGRFFPFKGPDNVVN